MDKVKGSWLKFLRQYGPIARNDNMYDETILRSARRYKLKPIEFLHPFRDDVVANFTSSNPVSVILTGTAGDGKTHLCRQVWKTLSPKIETSDLTWELENDKSPF